MANTNPLTLLRLQVDPLLKAVSSETPIIGGSLLSIMKKTLLKGVNIPKSNILELEQPYSIPIASQGNSWVYRAMQSKYAQGKVKFEKFTLQSIIDEDDMDKLKALGESSLIGQMKASELKMGILFLQDQIARYASDPWGGVTTSVNYDANIIGLFASSAGGTMTNPSDMNATAGTPKVFGLKMSGSNQDTRVIEKISAEVRKGMIVLDAKSSLQIPIGKLFVGVHPIMKAILDNTSDILDSTSGYRSPNTMTEDLAKRGITVIENVGFDPTYVGGEDDTGKMIFFADPSTDFEILGIVPKEGDGWTPWDPLKITVGDAMTISYEKHKKLQVAFRPMAWASFATAAATAPTFFKKVWQSTVVGFDDV